MPFSYKYSPVSIGCTYGYKFSAEVRYWKVSSRGLLPADNVLFAQCSCCSRRGNAETVEMGRILFVIIDAECAGQYGTQCGEVGEKGKILFTITFLFEDTFVQQIGQIFVHAFGKTGRFFSEFFALPIRFICFIDVFGWAICHFCHFVLMKRRAKRRGGDGWSRGNFLVTRL